MLFRLILILLLSHQTKIQGENPYFGGFVNWTVTLAMRYGI